MSSDIKNHTVFDIVIVGGGPAGCATAISLKQNSNLKVLLIEEGSFDKIRIGETIPPNIRPLLYQLGLWPRFCADGHISCNGSMSIWGSERLGYNDHLVNTNGTAWHLNRRLFDDMLLSEMVHCGVEVRLGTTLKKIRTSKSDDGKTLLYLKDTDGLKSVTTRFIVDGSGQHAVVARHLGAIRQRFDRMVFVIGQFKISENSNFPTQTILEAVKEGWWYAAKLPDNTVLVACATDGDVLKIKNLTKYNKWLMTLAESKLIAPYLLDAKFVHSSFTIRTSFSCLMEPCFGPNWIAVGDAASSFDPIAALGIYKGINSGIECANSILAILNGKMDAGIKYSKARFEEFEEYEIIRTHFYEMEKRWRNSPFWRNRSTHEKEVEKQA